MESARCMRADRGGEAHPMIERREEAEAERGNAEDEQAQQVLP